MEFRNGKDEKQKMKSKTRWLVKNINKKPDLKWLAADRAGGDDKAGLFLNSQKEGFYDPYLMQDMGKAVSRIRSSIENHKLICVYGDYDVDGMSAVAILLKTFKAINYDKVTYYIPSREKEGYGVNMTAADKIINAGVDLVVTVDCGITNINEIKLLSESGIDTIITDHHRLLDELPKAYAVLNPKKQSCEYPDKNLCGAGIAYKLALALLDSFGVLVPEDLILICGIATVADIVPLIGENRIIVAKALKFMQNLPNLGVKALIEVAGLDAKEVSAQDISYIIAPRINSSGRLGKPTLGVNLYMEKNPKRAALIAEEINKLNMLRRSIEKDILDKAVQNLDVSEDTCFILTAGAGWNSGVIGIVSSRLTGKYHLPSAVISLEDGIGKGSSRSVDGINIFDAMQEASDLLIKFGGHSQAAGFTIEEEKIPEFYDRLSDIFKSRIKESNIVNSITADGFLGISDINYKFLKELKALEPHGHSNPKPVFILRNRRLQEPSAIGRDKTHFKAYLTGSDGSRISLIAFSKYDEFMALDFGKPVDIMFHLHENVYNNMTSLQLNVIDIRQSYDVKKYFKYLKEAAEELVKDAMLEDGLPAREENIPYTVISSEDIKDFPENSVFVCHSYKSFEKINLLLYYADIQNPDVRVCPIKAEIDEITRKNGQNIVFCDKKPYFSGDNLVFHIYLGDTKNPITENDMDRVYMYIRCEARSFSSISRAVYSLKIDPFRLFLYIYVLEQMGCLFTRVDFNTNMIKLSKLYAVKKKKFEEFEIIKNLISYFS